MQTTLNTQHISQHRPRGTRDGTTLSAPPAHPDTPTAPADAPRALGREHGAVTAEYAIATLAAVGFAALLVVILKSGEVRALLFGIIRNALQIPG